MDATHDTTALTLAVASGFLLFAGGFWMIVSLGQWALAPIDRPRGVMRLPMQFSLREFLLLMLQMQLAIAAGLWWGDGQSSFAMLAAVVIGSGLVIAWCHGVQRLSRCGVNCLMRRSVFLLLVTPLAGLTIVAALWLNGRAVLDTCLGNEWSLTPWLIGNFVIIGAFVTCRLLTVWAMRDVTTRSPVALPDEDIQYVSPQPTRG